MASDWERLIAEHQELPIETDRELLELFTILSTVEPATST